MSETTKSILVVDDYEGIREGMASMLQQNGYLTAEAQNGEEAMQLLKQQAMDMVITDILMPDMDGFELVKEVQKAYPETKFILISGGGRHLDMAAVPDFLAMGTRLTGVEAVLKKPFKPEELLNMVANELNS